MKDANPTSSKIIATCQYCELQRECEWVVTQTGWNRLLCSSCQTKLGVKPQ